MYRILSFDGGGLYGVLAVVILQRLITEYPDLIKNTDVIAGTSIGGIMAIALANEITVDQLLYLFQNEAAQVFTTSKIRKAAAYCGFKAFYSNDEKQKVVYKYLGDTKLKDLKKKVVIPAFQLDNHHKQWKPKLFHNFKNSNPTCPNLTSLNKTSRDVTALDVAMATSSAPLYFPSWGSYIDGGVVENNPSLAAIAQVLDDNCIVENRPKLEEISVLSIGSGSIGDYVSGDNLDLGWNYWITKIFSVFIHGDVTTTDYQTRQIIGKRYNKICPILPIELNRSIDDLTLIPDLIEYGKTMNLDSTIKWLKDTKW